MKVYLDDVSLFHVAYTAGLSVEPETIKAVLYFDSTWVCSRKSVDKILILLYKAISAAKTQKTKEQIQHQIDAVCRTHTRMTKKLAIGEL